MKKSMISAAAALFALAAMQGCGGGGGGGGAGFAVPTASAAASAPAPAPVEPPVTAPAPAPASTPAAPEPSTPVVDPTACLTAPQPGSAADVGNGYEGVWYQHAATGVNGLMLVGAAGDSTGFTVPASSTASMVESMFYGAFNFDTTNSSWQIGSGKVNAYPSTAWGTLSGSGSFVPKTSLDGTYAENAAPSKSFGPWKYELENSLAVDSTLLTGTWGGYMSNILGSIDIASNGSFTGTTAVSSPFGSCALTGSVLPREPGTRKNNLSVTLNVTNAAQSGQKSCAMGSLSDGLGFVEVTQDTTNGVCERSMRLYMFFKDSAGNYSATLAFPK